MMYGTFTLRSPENEIRAQQQCVQPHPTAPDTAVIMCHWNWGGFSRPVQNLNRCLRQLRTMNIPVFGLEAVTHTQRPATLGFAGWSSVRINERQVMFQKESMLNVLEGHVPPNYTKLIWLDHDLWFENPDWFVLTARALERCKVVQPFSTAVWTDEFGRGVQQCDGAMANPSGTPGAAHPGFAMAAQRDLWQNGGLIDRLIVGSGDTIFARAACNLPLICPERQLRLWDSLRQPAMERLIAPMYARLRNWVSGSVDFVRGNVVHEWHGSKTDRGYVSRLDLYELCDAAKHITHAPNGLLTWTEDTPPEAVQFARNYFLERKEDG